LTRTHSLTNNMLGQMDKKYNQYINRIINLIISSTDDENLPPQLDTLVRNTMADDNGYGTFSSFYDRYKYMLNEYSLSDDLKTAVFALMCTRIDYSNVIVSTEPENEHREFMLTNIHTAWVMLYRAYTSLTEPAHHAPAHAPNEDDEDPKNYGGRRAKKAEPSYKRTDYKVVFRKKTDEVTRRIFKKIQNGRETEVVQYTDKSKPKPDPWVLVSSLNVVRRYKE